MVGTQWGNVKNEKRGMQREGERQLEEHRREIGIDWGQTWLLIEGMDQWWCNVKFGGKGGRSLCCFIPADPAHVHECADTLK